MSFVLPTDLRLQIRRVRLLPMCEHHVARHGLSPGRGRVRMQQEQHVSIGAIDQLDRRAQRDDLRPVAQHDVDEQQLLTVGRVRQRL